MISNVLETHKHLVLAVIAGVVLWFGIGKVDQLIANHDHAALQQAQVVAQVQADKTAAIAAQVVQQAVQFQSLAEKAQVQNVALIQANAQLAAALAKQQKTDATLPPSDLVSRLNVLVPQAGAVLTTKPDGVILPTQGTIAVVQQLEQVPVLSTQLENERTQLGNAQELLTASSQQVATLDTEVGSLNLQLGDDAKVCAVQIATVKADARKSKKRWFLAGYVAGLVTRGAIRLLTGV